MKIHVVEKLADKKLEKLQYLPIPSIDRSHGIFV